MIPTIDENFFGFHRVIEILLHDEGRGNNEFSRLTLGDIFAVFINKSDVYEHAYASRAVYQLGIILNFVRAENKAYAACGAEFRAAV